MHMSNRGWWVLFAGIALVALALGAPLARADSFANAQCSDIQVEPSQIGVLPGSETQTVFSIRNAGPEAFYLDRVEVYDNVEGIVTEAQGHSAKIDSQSFGTLGVRIRALDSGNRSDATGFVAIYGHFGGGLSCGPSQVNITSFPIRFESVVPASSSASFASSDFIGGNRVSYACADVFASVPADWDLAQGDSFLARLVNDSDYRATFYFGGDGVDASPSGISVPAHTEYEETVSISSTKRVAWMQTQIANAGCSGSKWTRVLNTSVQRPGAISYPASFPANPQPIPPTSNVEISARASTDRDRYSVAVLLVNMSSSPAQGELNAMVPDGWKVAGAGLVQLSGGESRTVNLNLIPAELPSQSQDVLVSFTSGSDRVFSHVTLEPLAVSNSSGASSNLAGFFSLASARFMGFILSWWLWLLALIIVVWLFWQSNKNRADIEPWMTTKANAALQKN